MAQGSVRLNGIAWRHTRRYIPMVATAQRFHELHPSVELEWQGRSRQNFGEDEQGNRILKFPPKTIY